MIKSKCTETTIFIIKILMADEKASSEILFYVFALIFCFNIRLINIFIIILPANELLFVQLFKHDQTLQIFLPVFSVVIMKNKNSRFFFNAGH